MFLCMAVWFAVGIVVTDVLFVVCCFLVSSSLSSSSLSSLLSVGTVAVAKPR
jgi:hypothetical protein